jgi:hypothetical protein
MSRFVTDVRTFVAKTERKMTTAVRKISLDAFSEVIVRSPVDTGRFRGNWLCAIGNVPDGVIELLDPTGQAAISAVTAETMKLRAGDVIHLANNLPYGPRLEEGWSKQAPNGMVRLTAQRFQAIANAVIAEVARQ